MAMGAFAPSLLGWAGSSKATTLRIRVVPAAWVFAPDPYACPGWEWVHVIAIAWGRMVAGYCSHVVDEFLWSYLRLQREETDNVTRWARVHTRVCICMGQYIWLYFSRGCQEVTWLSTTPEGSSPPTLN